MGIAWSGSTGLRNDKRSMALERMLPLLRGGIDWVSLQKEVPPGEAALLASRRDVFDASAGLSDFAQTAALVELLDLVITVDTSVAHVAGALGKPVWILLPFNPHDWRWLLAREDSVWYPQATLLRQASPGDWAGVLFGLGCRAGVPPAHDSLGRTPPGDVPSRASLAFRIRSRGRRAERSHHLVMSART